MCFICILYSILCVCKLFILYLCVTHRFELFQRKALYKYWVLLLLILFNTLCFNNKWYNWYINWFCHEIYPPWRTALLPTIRDEGRGKGGLREADREAEADMKGEKRELGRMRRAWRREVIIPFSRTDSDWWVLNKWQLQTLSYKNRL